MNEISSRITKPLKMLALSKTAIIRLAMKSKKQIIRGGVVKSSRIYNNRESG